MAATTRRKPGDWDQGFVAWISSFLREPDGSLVTPSALAGRWNFDPETVIGWVDGSARPQRRNCYRLADLTGAPVEQILESAGYGRPKPRAGASTLADARAIVARIGEVLAPTGDLPPGLFPITNGEDVHAIAVVMTDDLAPTIAAGDVILIDRADLWMRPDVTMALLGPVGVMVRRAVATPEGGVLLVDADCTAWRPDGSTLVGRVLRVTKSI